MARTPEQHSADSRAAAHTMWGGVTDRAERLRNMHNNSPSGYAWHARRLYGADVDVEKLTKTQWKAVEAARLSWLHANALKAAKASTRVRKLRKAKQLRARADRLDAEAAGEAASA